MIFVRTDLRAKDPSTKKREPRAPSIKQIVEGCLRADLHSKVQLPHLRVRRQAGDQAGTGAVDTVVWIVEVYVVEHVERFKAELRADSLRNRKVLEQ